MRYLGVLFLLLFSAFCSASHLKKISIKSIPNHESVALNFEITGKYQYHSFTLSNPDRVVIDLTDVKEGAYHEVREGDVSEVLKIRIGHPKPHVLRLVFDTAQPMEIIKVTPIERYGEGDLQLEIKSQTVKKIVKQEKPLRDIIVVLDPGHGGKDPGAFGARKTPEKDVVLAIAKKLKQKIDKQPGMRAILTRQGDYYVGLRERLDIARKHNADVFVSIHADAFIHPHSKGASVFALSQRGATSEAARWLAEKENYSELGGVNLSDLNDQNDLIRSVLIDLSQTATTTASLQMGGQVLKRLDKVTVLHSDDVEQARFVVLKSPDIPSILIETGFISNPKEEKNLTSPRYQIKLTEAIFEGLKTYFWSHPPHGTHMEAEANQKMKIVRTTQPPLLIEAARGHA